jgi:hypothetical protein
MTTSSMARPTTGAGPTPDRNTTMTDRDMHHLFDLIRDDHIRFKHHQHVDLDGVGIDDLVYAAEDAGLVAVHPEGVVKVTEKGRRWRDSHHRPARATAIVFQQPVGVA